MKKILMIMVMMFVFSGTALLAQEETASDQDTDKMTMEEFEKRLKEETANYEEQLQKMSGSMEAYYLIYDYMGRGYVTLDADLILQIKDFETLSSNKFDVALSGKDDMGFTLSKKWKFDKKEAYVNPEGDAVVVLKFALEKGNYNNISITITGNKGENATTVVDRYETLHLSDLKLKLSDSFLIGDVNGVQRNEFFRRRYFILPNIRGYYEKNMQMGFYFEYYHLAVDALYKEGSYNVDYKITFAPTETEVYRYTDEKKEVGENGQYIMYLPDISNLIDGIYRIDYVFTDQMTSEEKSGTLYFKVHNPEENAAETTANEGEGQEK